MDAERATRMRRQLRVFAIVTLVIASACAVCSQLPGRQIYKDADDCLAAAFSPDVRGHVDCGPADWHLHATERVGGDPLLWFLVIMMLPGALLIAEPRRGVALAWWMISIPATLIAAAKWFDPMAHFLDKVEDLAPGTVIHVGVPVVVMLVVIALPVYLLVTRAPRPKPPAPALPEARIV